MKALNVQSHRVLWIFMKSIGMVMILLQYQQ